MMWMGLAAAAMYFFDPERGEKRRSDLRRKFEGYRKTAENTTISDLKKTV